MNRAVLALSLTLAAVGLFLRPATATGPINCTDYRAKGHIRVLTSPDLPVKQGETRDEVNIRLEQVYLHPDRMLLHVDWSGLQQSMLAEGATEQIYQPSMGMIIEKHYLHLEKADDNPIVAAQTSIVDLGRHLRDAHSAHPVGKEKVLGYDCDIIEASTREVLEKSGGLVTPNKSNGLIDGKLKAWVAATYGVPVKLEMFTAAGNLGASLNMDELQINSGVKPEELRLDAPAGTKKVSIDVDLADKDWQQKMNLDLRKAVQAANNSRTHS